MFTVLLLLENPRHANVKGETVSVETHAASPKQIMVT